MKQRQPVWGVLKILICFVAVVLVLWGVPPTARADTVFAGSVDMSGTGFGNVNTVMTMQATGKQMGGVESGCVGVSDAGRLNTTVQWLDQHHQTDPDLCQGGNVGGSEVPPSKFPHNQTLVVTNASDIAVVFNSDQPAGGTVSLSNLVFVLFNANGQVGFTSGATSQVFTSTESEPGIGNSGWEFVLDPAQAAAAQAAINAGYGLFGLSATVTDSYGGPETFYLTNSSTITAPESATVWFLGAGLFVVGIYRRLNRRLKTYCPPFFE